MLWCASLTWNYIVEQRDPGSLGPASREGRGEQLALSRADRLGCTQTCALAHSHRAAPGLVSFVVSGQMLADSMAVVEKGKYLHLTQA